MPPKRTTPATPQSVVAPSPARSTRSASHSVRGEDEWEAESVSSFKVPNSRTGRGNDRNFIGLKDTSVNVAAAFHAAQMGQLPTPAPDRSFSAPRKPTSRAKPPSNNGRAQSPIEQLANSARALSPVRFFLRQTDEGEDPSMTSFSSLGSGGKSTDTSYDYAREEEYVRAAHEHAAKNRRVSDGRRRKLNDEDMPYRPAEDDWQPDSEDSGGEGEGIVRGGALDGRAGTRGTRQQRGEGYLGMGLGIQPKTRRRGQRGQGGGDEEEEEDVDRSREQTPMANSLEVHHTPNGRAYRRSPTPAQIVARALSPMLERRSPAPAYAQHRKRQPSSGRTVITNILHGLALTLQFAVEVITAILSGIVLKPIRAVFGSGKQFLWKAQKDWWKWVGGVLVLSLALRMLEQQRWGFGRPYAAPNVPPGSVDELVSRLTHLEQVVAVLSDSKAFTETEREGKTEDILGRVTELEKSLQGQQRQPEGSRRSDGSDIKDVRKSISSLQSEVGDLAKKVKQGAKDLSSTQGKIASIEDIGSDIKGLNQRVAKVEKDLTSVLDDGRFRAALERILPDRMPAKINSGGTVDVDPIFWTEMKRVLVGKGELDTAIRRALDSHHPAGDRPSTGNVKTDRELEEWGERLLERKTSEGVILTRADFVTELESEVKNLKEMIGSLPRHLPAASSGVKTPPSSSITLKSTKGEDVTGLLQDLVDAALLRYSKDTLARPDYALFSAGGRVVPSITSDTLVMRTASKFGRVVLGRKDIEGRSPATALHPDNSVGACWPFKGSQGQLGVLLNRRVVITDITLEHAAKDLALDMSSAPKEVEVWGLVEGAENKAKVEDYKKRHPVAASSTIRTPDQIRLGAFEYDANSDSPIQTFPIEPEIVDLGLDMGIVIFRILSNWDGEFTCLYRVRVHGEVAEQVQ